MEEGVESQLTGFDPQGEPFVRRTAEGRLWLCIQLMPPSWAPEEDGLGPWRDFDSQLSEAIGVPVKWADREWFCIDQPKDDTVDAIQRFLVDIRERYDVNETSD